MNNGLVSKQSKFAVAETMDRLEAAIKDYGANVWARIDLKAAAPKGETLRPHQIVIFGTGGALQPLLRRPQRVVLICLRKYSSSKTKRAKHR